MSSYFYLISNTQSHRFAHSKSITRMKSTGNVCLIDVGHEFGIVSDSFAKVAVKSHSSRRFAA
jgi:hypothetical protein